MKKQFCALSLLFCLPALLTACAGAATPGAEPAILSTTFPTATLTQPPTSTPLPATATPTATISPQCTQYTLTAELDYPQHRLTISEAVSYSNRSADKLSALVFVVEPDRQAGEFQLTSLHWADGNAVQGFTLAGGELTLPLMQPLAPGQTVEVSLTYMLDLPSARGVLSFDSRQVNLAGWYPYLPPYIEGEGWRINPPGTVGEYQVYELADFDVSFMLKEAPAGLVVAASAVNDSAVGGYHYLQKGVRNFTLSASTDYVQLNGLAGQTPVTAYVFSGDETAGQASLETTIQALNLYSSLYGPYTRPSLTLVEADFADGMEYDGLYFLGKEYFKAYTGNPAGYLVALSAHETAHQWWYAMIGSDQARESWLDEALATYSERLFYEHQYPDLVNWWWQTRVQGYSPAGWVNSTIYNFTAFRPYVNAVYLRGAEFLEELRTTIGDEAFFAFLSGYFSSIQAEGQKDDLAFSSAARFWDILGQYNQTDVSGLKNRYFKP